MESPVDLLLLPVLLTFFGALVYGLTVDAGLKKGRLGPSRWVGVAIVALGLISGFSDTWMMTDAFNRVAIGETGKKVIVAHYLAGLLPFFVLVGCVVFDLAYARKMVKRRRY